MLLQMDYPLLQNPYALYCDNKWSSFECDMCEKFDMYENKKENKEV